MGRRWGMYSVGSVGAVDPGDISKVVCGGSVIQLGRGIGGLEPPAAVSGPEAAAPAIGFPRVTATVRYSVPPDVRGELGGLMLVLRYRSGDGHVAATLMEVATLLEVFDDPGSVTETPLLKFDSAEFDASNRFQTKSVGGPTGPNPSHVIDFSTNVYYVALSLTGPEFITGQPPAVSVIELVPFIQF